MLDFENEALDLTNFNRHELHDHDFVVKNKKFVQNSSWSEPCSLTQEMTGHPLIRSFLKVIAALFGTILCLLLCTCFKYQQVNSAFSKLKETTK